MFRIRKSWEDIKSQIGAYSLLQNAINIFVSGTFINDDYKIFDENGVIVYPEQYHKVALQMIDDGVTTNENLNYWDSLFKAQKISTEDDIQNIITILDRYQNRVKYLKENQKEISEIEEPSFPINYKVENGIHILEIPYKEFSIKYWDKPKKTSLIKNYFNLGYFAGGCKNPDGTTFSLPVANLVCDINENEIKPYVLNFLRKGKIQNNKLWFNTSANDGDQFKGKNVSTLVIDNGGVHIYKYKEISDDPQWGVTYAISGAPVITNGKQTIWSDIALEGWDTSIYRATWHGFLGLKDNNTIYYLAFETTTSNLFTGEAYNKLKTYNFKDVIKVDAGGSFIFDYEGKNVAITNENRSINNIGMFI